VKSSVEDFFAALKPALPLIIGVDGTLGSGKTRAANRIATTLDLPCVHVDDFLLPGRSAFTSNIDYLRLRQKIDDCKAAYVIEGICLLAALRNVAVTPDYLIFVDPDTEYAKMPKALILVDEVNRYLSEYSPRSSAHTIISRGRSTMSRSPEVDIAYIRAKTMISVVLAFGGLVQTISGALLLNAGLNNGGTASFSLMGAQFSATGLGGIVLCTSVLWAFLAYRARPQYSHTSQSKNSTKSDGSSESYVFETSTQRSANPFQAPGDTRRDN